MYTISVPGQATVLQEAESAYVWLPLFSSTTGYVGYVGNDTASVNEIQQTCFYVAMREIKRLCRPPYCPCTPLLT